METIDTAAKYLRRKKMSETTTDQQNQKPATSKLAIASAVLGFLGICSWALSRIFWFPNTPGDMLLIRFLFCCLHLSMPLALAFSIAAILGTRSQRTTAVLSSTLYATLGIACSIFLLIVVIVLPRFPRASVYQEACRGQIDIINHLLVVYASEHNNKYPPPNNWCDSICQNTKENEYILKCPAAKDSRSNYAINPNCKPDSPPDMVLVFETKDGWNQQGGPDLLTTENHKEKGSNILFNNGTIRFIRTDELQTLKWKPEPETIEK